MSDILTNYLEMAYAQSTFTTCHVSMTITEHEGGYKFALDMPKGANRSITAVVYSARKPQVVQSMKNQRLIMRLMKEIGSHGVEKLVLKFRVIIDASSVSIHLGKISFLNSVGYHHDRSPSRIDISNSRVVGLGFYNNGVNTIPRELYYPSFVHTSALHCTDNIIPGFYDRVPHKRISALYEILDGAGFAALADGALNRVQVYVLDEFHPNLGAFDCAFTTMTCDDFCVFNYLGRTIPQEYFSILEYPLKDEHIFMLNLL